MLAIYRKYRPKTFDDLVGQDVISTILKNAAAANKIAHAYLLYGPRGTGKTTTARIIARTANCLKRKEDATFAKKGIPCGECAACAQIEQGNALDVIEIDAASNRGIDEIRNLKETIKTLPSIFTYKVFIIDEVHMLTTPAFNALLKTLEEPPAHALFILATTEYEKVPATIVSRTQRFHFKKLTFKDIVGKLEYIAKEENIHYEKEALEMIARLADGSARDAESLLDQIIGLKNTTINTHDIEEILGKVTFIKTIEMATLLIEKKGGEALEYLYDIYNSGHNLFQFNKDLTEYLRRALALHLNASLEKMFEKEISQTELEEMKKLSKSIDTQYIVMVIKNLIEAYANMRYNPFPITPFEIAIIESTEKRLKE